MWDQTFSKRNTQIQNQFFDFKWTRFFQLFVETIKKGILGPLQWNSINEFLKLFWSPQKSIGLNEPINKGPRTDDLIKKGIKYLQNSEPMIKEKMGKQTYNFLSLV